MMLSALFCFLSLWLLLIQLKKVAPKKVETNRGSRRSSSRTTVSYVIRRAGKQASNPGSNDVGLNTNCLCPPPVQPNIFSARDSAQKSRHRCNSLTLWCPCTLSSSPTLCRVFCQNLFCQQQGCNTRHRRKQKPNKTPKSTLAKVLLKKKIF